MSDQAEAGTQTPSFQGLTPGSARREVPFNGPTADGLADGPADEAEAGRDGFGRAFRPRGMPLHLGAPREDELVAGLAEEVPAGAGVREVPKSPEEAPPSLEAIQFSVHVSMRYHARRRAWYDRFHRWSALVLALAGSSCAVAIFGGLLQEAEILSMAVAVAGASEVAFDLSGRARAEDALYRRFNALACDIAGTLGPDEARLRDWNERRLLIKADADDRLERLRRVCHDLECGARGYGRRRASA
jgi:hypothetical protein